MPFDDLTQYLDPSLDLTVKGRVYRVPPASAELGLWCRTVAAANDLDEDATDEQLQETAKRVSDLPPLPEGKTLPEHMLGSAYAEMVRDKVEDPYIQFCAQTVLISIIAGEDAAERFWMTGGHPEAMARGNRAQRRATARAGTGTAAAGETRQLASTSGTTSRPKSGGSGRGRRSRGRRS
jgi:hypothetical protein